jgi:hypothetical protein
MEVLLRWLSAEKADMMGLSFSGSLVIAVVVCGALDHTQRDSYPHDSDTRHFFYSISTSCYAAQRKNLLRLCGENVFQLKRFCTSRILILSLVKCTNPSEPCTVFYV